MVKREGGKRQKGLKLPDVHIFKEERF